ncbi:MAG: hypothetical protein KJ067_23360 [Vicinamibacteria bacterium]|nr:hypothetical protein [Vicinamibacteria bacterium]
MSATAPVPRDPLLDALDQVRAQLDMVREQLGAVQRRALEQAVFARVLETEDIYLGPEEAGILLGISRTSVAEAVEAGQLARVPAPGTTSGWRVPLSSIRYLQHNQKLVAETERKARARAASRALARVSA